MTADELSTTEVYGVTSKERLEAADKDGDVPPEPPALVDGWMADDAGTLTIRGATPEGERITCRLLRGHGMADGEGVVSGLPVVVVRDAC